MCCGILMSVYPRTTFCGNIHIDLYVSPTAKAGFHNHLFRLKSNPKYCMQNYAYYRQIYQEC